MRTESPLRASALSALYFLLEDSLPPTAYTLALLSRFLLAATCPLSGSPRSVLSTSYSVLSPRLGDEAFPDEVGEGFLGFGHGRIEF